MIGASVLVHAFLTPFPALWGLVAMLPALQLPDSSAPPLIEVDMIPLAPAAPEPQHERASEPVEPAAAPEPEPPATDEVEEEAPKAEEPPVKEPEPVQPLEELPELPLVPSEPFGDPVALAGGAGEIADSNANVRLFIYADVVRNHPIGEEVSALMKVTPQWKDFFGPSAIDPIEDVDRVLIAGPQLRDSSQVVAVVQHRLSEERIDQAFDTLVRRKGSWVDREARLARADADRASRLFSAPNKEVVVVAPPQLEKQLRELGASTRFPKTDGLVALSAYIVTPANVAKGTMVRLPDSLKWARIDLRPSDDGGGVLKILAEDEDARSAKSTVRQLVQLLSQITIVESAKKKRSSGGFAFLGELITSQFKVKVQTMKFTSEENRIEGTIEFTQAQLLDLMGKAKTFLIPPETNGALPSGSAAERAKRREETLKKAMDQIQRAPKTAQPPPPTGKQPPAPEADRDSRQN